MVKPSIPLLGLGPFARGPVSPVAVRTRARLRSSSYSFSFPLGVPLGIRAMAASITFTFAPILKFGNKTKAPEGPKGLLGQRARGCLGAQRPQGPIGQRAKRLFRTLPYQKCSFWKPLGPWALPPMHHAPMHPSMHPSMHHASHLRGALLAASRSMRHAP